MLATRRLTKTAVRQAPTKAAAKLPTVGDVGKRGGGMWAALADSDSEESDTGSLGAAREPELSRRAGQACRSVIPVKRPAVIPVTPVAEKKVVTVPAGPTDLAAAWRAAFESDPFFLAMERGEKWGDLLYAPAPRVVAEAAEEEADPLAAIYTNPCVPLRAREADIWEQPFALNLEEYWSDTYDTREMSDADYHAMMGWIYSKGWYVVAHDRDGVQTWPDNAAALRWNPATMEAEDERHVRWADMEAPAKACCGAGHSHGHRAPAAAKKGAVTIPRFCREGAACTAGSSCRYVHGDTIPRVNEPCAFGAGCGASDPTGVKRSQCLRMHPGEVWSPELVIRRI